MKEQNQMLDIVQELYKAFRCFNKVLFNNEIEEPVITIQSNGNRKLSWGWCTTREVWHDVTETSNKMYEINLVAEGLFRTFEDIMITLAHEMVHLWDLQHNIKDVSRNNTYHNKKFRAKALEIGLEPLYNEKIGWCKCLASPKFKNLIENSGFNKDVFVITKLNKNLLNEYKFSKGLDDNRINKKLSVIDNEDTNQLIKKKSATYKRFVCDCSPQKIFRATKELKNIRCEDCGSLFYESYEK